MKNIALILLLIPVLILPSFLHPYIGPLRGVRGDLGFTADFTPSMFVGFGYRAWLEGGYSGFAGNLAFDVGVDLEKNGGSIFRIEDGKVVEYKFPMSGENVYKISAGVGVGDTLIYGLDTWVKMGKELKIGLLPAVGFKGKGSILSVFSGIDSSLDLYAGVRYLNDSGWDARVYAVIGKESKVNLEFESGLMKTFLSYSPIYGDLALRAELTVAGVVVGGGVLITDELEYFSYAGMKFSFGSVKPESWYIDEVLKLYSKKDFTKAFELVSEAEKLYPNSQKIKKYSRMVEREYISSKMLASLSSGKYLEARRLASDLLKKYFEDQVVLKRCQAVSEETVLKAESYGDLGLDDSEVKEFANAVFHYLSGDYDYAIRVLSQLLVKHRDNDRIRVKLAEVMAVQGNWKAAEKVLSEVKEKVTGYSYARAIVLLRKEEASPEDFISVLREGDIDHIRDALFHSVETAVSRKEYSKAIAFGALLNGVGYGGYSIEATYYLGLAYYNLGKLREAVDYLSEAVGYYESTPKSQLTDLHRKIYEDSLERIVKAYETLARSRREYYLSAADYIARMIKITTDPKEREELIKKRALFLYKARAYEEALYEFESLIEKDKKYEKYYYSSKARYLFQKLMKRIVQQSFPVSMLIGDFEKVVDSYEKVLKIDPTILDDRDYVDLVYSSAVAGRFDIAEKALARLTKSDYSKILKAFVDFSRGDMDKALEELKGIELKGLDDFYKALYYKMKGRVYYAKGDYKKAIENLEVFFDKYRGIGVDGDDIVAISNAYMKIGKPEKVLEVVSEERLGGSAGLYLIRAQALMKLGRYEDAFKTLEELAESPMMNDLSDDLKIKAYKMMGELAFQIGNYWKAKDYFERAVGISGGELEGVSDKYEISKLLVRKVDEGEVDLEGLRKLSKSSDEDVKVIASVELADVLLSHGNTFESLEILKDLEPKSDRLKGFVNYEMAKIEMVRRNFERAFDHFLKAWKVMKSRKILRKAFAMAIVSGKYGNIYTLAKDYLKDPILGDMARFIVALGAEEFDAVSPSDSFLAEALYRMITGDFEEIEEAFWTLYENQDVYGKLSMNKLLEIVGMKGRDVKLADDDDPVEDYLRSKVLGTLKEWESFSKDLKVGSTIEWKYEHGANKYVLMSLMDGKVLQKSRKRKYRFEREGIYVLKIKAVKGVGGVYVEDETPPFVVRVSRNLPPKIVEVFPRNGMEVYQRTIFRWKAEDPEGDDLNFEVFYGADIHDLKRIFSDSNELRMDLGDGGYLWFVKVSDSHGNVGYSPLVRIKASDVIRLVENWRAETMFSRFHAFFMAGNALVVISSSGDVNVVNLNDPQKVISFRPIKNFFMVSQYAGSPDGRIFLANVTELVCFDLTGRVLWRDKNTVSSNIAIDENGDVFYGTSEGKIYARDRNGNLKWTFPKMGFMKVNVDRIVVTNKWIVFTSPSDDGYWVIWIDKNGNPLAQVKFSSTTYGMVGPIVDEDGTVYMAESKGRLVAMRMGEILWEKNGLNEITSDLVEGGNGVYFTNRRGFLVKLSKRDGRILKMISTGWVWGFPKIILGENDEVYMFFNKKVQIIDYRGVKSSMELPGLVVGVVMGRNGEIYVKYDNGLIISYTGASFSLPKGWIQSGGTPFKSFYMDLRR